MSKELVTKDKHDARKIYDQYSTSLRKRKISPEFEEILELSSDDRCFRVKIVGTTTIEDLLTIIERVNAVIIPASWDKLLVSAVVYATKKQIKELLKKDKVKYIKLYEPVSKSK
ncbi:MAG: hypothetical protein ACTSQY_03560 [Candidatus Odinarchaeia archaeon]